MIERLNKEVNQPGKVLDTWVRLVIHHQGRNQGDVAVILGVTDSTLSKWRRGAVLPSTDWLLQKLVHGRGWVRLMAWQVLQAALPEVFAEVDFRDILTQVEQEALQAAGEVVSGKPVEVPWAV